MEDSDDPRIKPSLKMDKPTPLKTISPESEDETAKKEIEEVKRELKSKWNITFGPTLHPMVTRNQPQDKSRATSTESTTSQQQKNLHRKTQKQCNSMSWMISAPQNVSTPIEELVDLGPTVIMCAQSQNSHPTQRESDSTSLVNHSYPTPRLSTLTAKSCPQSEDSVHHVFETAGNPGPTVTDKKWIIVRLKDVSTSYPIMTESTSSQINSNPQLENATSSLDRQTLASPQNQFCKCSEPLVMPCLRCPTQCCLNCFKAIIQTSSKLKQPTTPELDYSWGSELERMIMKLLAEPEVEPAAAPVEPEDIFDEISNQTTSPGPQKKVVEQLKPQELENNSHPTDLSSDHKETRNLSCTKHVSENGNCQAEVYPTPKKKYEILPEKLLPEFVPASWEEYISESNDEPPQEDNKLEGAGNCELPQKEDLTLHGDNYEPSRMEDVPKSKVSCVPSLCKGNLPEPQDRHKPSKDLTLHADNYEPQGTEDVGLPESTASCVPSSCKENLPKPQDRKKPLKKDIVPASKNDFEPQTEGNLFEQNGRYVPSSWEELYLSDNEENIEQTNEESQQNNLQNNEIDHELSQEESIKKNEINHELPQEESVQNETNPELPQEENVQNETNPELPQEENVQRNEIGGLSHREEDISQSVHGKSWVELREAERLAFPFDSFHPTLQQPRLPQDRFGTIAYKFEEGDAFSVFQVEKGKVIGNGRFKENVYLAYNLWDFPVKKVVKIIKHDEQPTLAKLWFTQEVSILSKLRHTNVVSMLGYTCTPAHYGILLEYINRGSVQDLVGHLTTRQVEDYFLQMTLGLAFMHSHQIVHRDFKLGNTLVTTQGVLKIADFDVAGTLKPGCTHVIGIVGTEMYRAPEIDEHPNSWYDAYKVDAFALGVGLFCMMFKLKHIYRTQLYMHTFSSWPPYYYKYRNYLELLVFPNPAVRLGVIQLLNTLIVDPNFGVRFAKAPAPENLKVLREGTWINP